MISIDEGGQRSRRPRSTIPQNLAIPYPMAESAVKRTWRTTSCRVDPLSPVERSARMAKVRSKANRSTEVRVAATLAAHGFRGWKRHVAGVAGRPDFYFVDARVVVFVDGCFWHGCRECGRRVPRSRRTFWREKIAGNRRRDRCVTRQLRGEGYRVVRIWEHSLGTNAWLARIRRAIQVGESATRFARARSADANGVATT